ncbi:hypothetical protein FGO68_gene3577 [Halteria grandinella]|uniref:FHA domain-containing protein n=1 Tax=Halteria grandinella TaxID=5974 RepID=A0A8J8NY97_HALGN|nr:hypothetical protein FGO68_gene3577 [Halteria grandinella]
MQSEEIFQQHTANIIVTEAQVRNAPQLTINVVEIPDTSSETLPSTIQYQLHKNQCLDINPLGGNSNLKNGATVFGTVPIGCNPAQYPINVVLAHGDDSNEEDDNTKRKDEDGDQNTAKRHFAIQYHPINNLYMIKDQGEGSGTFAKVEKPYTLANGTLISFGESHMVVQLHRTKHHSDVNRNKLVLKFLDGPRQFEQFTFMPQIGALKIGRMSECDIKLQDAGLSRVQCVVQYIRNSQLEEEGRWVLIDGNPETQQKSTNGTWVYLDEAHVVQDGMIFRACNYLFECKLL